MPKDRQVSIASMWASYESDVLPADAPDVQVSECRLAFHAGAWALLQAIKGLIELPDDEGVRQIEAWGRELLAFKKLIAGGR